jgi:hypothetical protein
MVSLLERFQIGGIALIESRLQILREGFNFYTK